MNNQTKAITNVDVLKTVTASHMVEGFKSYVKGWPVKFAGPVPTPEMLTVALLMGKNRKAGPESGFVAMQLRENGASVAELAAAFNSGPAHNHSRALSADNKGAGAHYFTRTKGNGRFYLTFTAKGAKAVERLLAGLSVEVAAGATAAVTGKPKPKPAATVAKTKKAASKAGKGKGKPDQVSPELMQAVEAEINERGGQLEPETHAIDEKTEHAAMQGEPRHADQQSDGHQK